MQHASDDLVAKWKIGIVETALEGQGVDAEIAGIETSPPGTRRRATLHGQRTKSGSIVGFFAKNSHHLIDTPDCILLDPALMNARPMLADFTRLAASRSTTVDLSVTATESGIDLSISGAKPADKAMLPDIVALAQKHDLARLTWNGEPLMTARPPTIAIGRAHVAAPPGAFLQATPQGQAVLTGHVLRLTEGAGKIVDIFAGCGTFSLPLAESADIHAVEGFADLLKAAETAWRHTPNLHRLTTETRDLFRRPLMPDELNRYDAAVIDPPRAGAAAQVDEIAASTLGRLAYVSCNPVTFARDAAVLTRAGFTIGPVTVVDQFRWSSHVELVAGFSR